MSLIRVNQVSSLPCCDVFNLSALILASCLSTSTCPSLFLFPLLSQCLYHHFLLSSWLLSVSLSLFLYGLFLFPCLSSSLTLCHCVFFCLSPSVSFSPLFSCFLLPTCWLPQSSTARTVISPAHSPCCATPPTLPSYPHHPLHLGAEDLGHPERKKFFPGSLYLKKVLRTGSRDQDSNLRLATYLLSIGLSFPICKIEAREDGKCPFPDGCSQIS